MPLWIRMGDSGTFRGSLRSVSFRSSAEYFTNLDELHGLRCVIERMQRQAGVLVYGKYRVDSVASSCRYIVE